MALELQKGRPADTTGRLDKEIRTYDLLDRLGVEYDRVDHAPAMTMEDCKEVDEILESMVCKNLFLCNRQETAFYLLMIPDTKVFHTKDLSAQIGSARLSFANPERVNVLSSHGRSFASSGDKRAFSFIIKLSNSF